MVRQKTCFIGVDTQAEIHTSLQVYAQKRQLGGHLAVYGYARVSARSQDLSIQLEALRSAGAEIIRSEKVTGTSTKDRYELKTLLEFLREGDTLLITRIDRLARSVVDLQSIVVELRSKGVDLMATEQPIDTSSAAGKAFFDMLSVFAEFETNLRRERQAEGIAKAKQAGKYRGRKKVIDYTKVVQLHENGVGASQIAKQLGISRASVYRYLPKFMDLQKSSLE